MGGLLRCINSCPCPMVVYSVWGRLVSADTAVLMPLAPRTSSGVAAVLNDDSVLREVCARTLRLRGGEEMRAVVMEPLSPVPREKQTTRWVKSRSVKVEAELAPSCSQPTVATDV